MSLLNALSNLYFKSEYPARLALLHDDAYRQHYPVCMNKHEEL